jgi:hypothetical protein
VTVDSRAVDRVHSTACELVRLSTLENQCL